MAREEGQAGISDDFLRNLERNFPGRLPGSESLWSIEFINQVILPELASFCFNQVQEGDFLGDCVAIVPRNFQKCFNGVIEDYPELKESLNEFENSYSWLLRIQDEGGRIYPRIVYYKAKLRREVEADKLEKNREINNIDVQADREEIREKRKLADKEEITAEDKVWRTQREYWKNKFEYCKLNLFLHEVTHIICHWVEHFAANTTVEFPLHSELVALESIKLKPLGYILEMEAWLGAEQLLRTLFSCRLIQEYVDYPTLLQIVVEEILVPHKERDREEAITSFEKLLERYSGKVATR